MEEVKRTERGWAGHCSVGDKCHYHRNTLLEYGRQKIIVSTVGRYMPTGEDKYATVGCDRYYETRAFGAEFEGDYWDANVCNGVEDSFDSIDNIERKSELEADEKHEAMIEKISKRMIDGTIKY